MSGIFISHSSLDNQVAETLRVRLAEKGYHSVFLDFDPVVGIPAGRNWERELYKQLRACRAVIVLWSQHFLASRWCFAEITHAKALGKHIFPIRIDSVSVDELLMGRQIIDATAGWEEAYTRLWRGLLSAGLDPADPMAWDSTRSPYPGLLAFQERDAAVFFGRDTEIRHALDLLNQLQRFGGSRLVLVLGASGSGKSSLVRAGLLPRLRRDPSTWLVVDPFRPLGRPFVEFGKALASTFSRFGKQRDPRRIDKQLKSPRVSPQATVRRMEGLLEELRQYSGEEDTTVLLPVDQCEELLTDTGAGEVENFLILLANALHSTATRLLVLGTLRSDFLGVFQEHPVLRGVSFESIPIGPMTKDRLVEVIAGPARIAGIELEPDLVPAIVGDTETSDALPLLAFTLRELWERYGEDGLLQVTEYREKLGGLGGAVARAAEAVLKAHVVESGRGTVIEGKIHLTDEDTANLRQSFLAMARINEEGLFARRPVKWTELPASVHPLLQRFITARLLAPRGREVEVAHEALFRAWARLTEWLDENRDLLLWRRRLGQAIAEWRRREGHESELLSGPALVEALGWRIRHEAHHVRLTEEEVTFIQASDEHERKEQMAREQQRQRELDQAKALAEEQARRSHASYLNRIALADRYWLEGQLRRSDDALGEYDVNGECGWEWRYLKRLLRSELTTLDSLPDGISGLAFVPGTLDQLASAGHDGSVRFWNLYNREPLYKPVSKGQPVIGFAFSKAGRFAVAYEQGALRLWDHPESPGRNVRAKCIETLGDCIPGGILALSTDGHRLATIVDHRVRIHDLESDHELWVSRPARFRKAAFLPEEDTVLTLTRSPNFVDDGRVGILEVWHLGVPAADRELHLLNVNDFAVSPDGGFVAVATESGPVLWDLSDGSQFDLPSGGRWAQFVDWSPDGDRLAVGVPDGTIDIWSVIEKRLLLSLRVSASGAGLMAFSPDGRAIATSIGDRVKVWDATTAQSAVTVAHSPFEPYRITAPSGQTTLFTGLSSYVPEVRPIMSSDGQYVAAVGESAVVYNTTSAREVFRTDFPSYHGGAAIAPDGDLLAVYAGKPLYEGDRSAVPPGNPVRFFELPVGSERPPVTPDTDWVNDLAFGAGGRSLVILGLDKGGIARLSIRSLAGEWRVELADGQTLSPPVAYGMRSQRVAAVADNAANIVQIWDAETGRRIIAIPSLPYAISALALGGAGDSLLAVADRSGSLHIWNVLEGQAVLSVISGANQITSLLLTKDGRRALIGSANGDIRILHIPSGDEILVLHGHKTAVSSLAFTSGEEALVSASGDGVVKIWSSDFPAGEPSGEKQSRRYWEFVERAPAWHLARAEEKVATDRSARAASFHLDLIDSSRLREISFLVRLGQAEARLGRWKQAWGAFLRATECGPVPPWVSFQRALIAVRLGTHAEFLRICEMLLESVERVPTASDLGALVVRTCVLAPLSSGEAVATTDGTARRVVALASALPPSSNYERARLGPALYRWGAASEALAAFTASGLLSEEDLLWHNYDRLFLALTLYATGDQGAARAEAKRLQKSLARKLDGFAWDDRLELELLSEEVASVLR